jgi:uncharacterized damage-inducible protein DinB
MPGQTAMFTTERDGLLAYLAQQRYVLRLTAFGLTDEQARQTPTTSPLSVGGLVKHVTHVEQGWTDMVASRQTAPAADSEAAYDDMFRMRADETLVDVMAAYEAVASETTRVIAATSLEHAVPVPQDVPWFPQDLDAWSVRWILLHLITETARHAGHADIVRESVDRGTAFPIMAAAEHWPATPWMTPWEPAVSAA